VFLLMMAVGLGVLAISAGVVLQGDRASSTHSAAPSLHALAIDCGPSHGSTISCTSAHGCTAAAPSEGCADTVVDTPPVAGTYRYELAPSAHPYASRQQITLAVAQAPAHADLAPGVTAGELRRLLPELPGRFFPALDHLYELQALPIGNTAGGVRTLAGDVGIVLACHATGPAITCQALAPGDQTPAGAAIYRLDWAQSRGVSPPPAGTARRAYDTEVDHALGGPPTQAESAVLAWLLPRPPAA
jgi:hypothetical protein